MMTPYRPGGLDAEHAAYGEAIEHLIAWLGEPLVDQWSSRFDRMVTWPE